MKIIENPDIEVRNLIKKALKANFGYCPCKLEKTEDTKCMCKEFRNQKSGPCHCGLYYKEKD